MMKELQLASDLLQVALDRYLKACLAVKRFYTENNSPPCPHNPTGLRLVDELARALTHEKKIQESKLTVLYSINRSPDVVPISKLPNDLLIHIFQQLVETVHGLPHVDNKSIPEYPLSLSQVCTHWRKIVSESPSLWSCIRINFYTRRDERLRAYTNFHTARARQALMDICISGMLSTTPIVPGLFEFVKPFSHRIKSLEFQMMIYGHPNDTHKIQDPLLSECLKASAGALRRLTITTSFTHDPLSERLHWFMESTSNKSSRNSLGISLPNSHLEDILQSVTELWLEGLYFNWTSKAYRGLTLLRLERSSPCSIPESQLLVILSASPQLRWVDIGLRIIQDVESPNLIHLPHLEVLVDTQDTRLLRLIHPGSNELTLSIPTDNRMASETIYDSGFKDFLSRANVKTLYSDFFLRNTSDVHYLLSIAPGIRVLALSFFELTDAPLNDQHGPRASLDKLFILSGCEVERSALQHIIETYQVKKLIFGGYPRNCEGDGSWSAQALVELSGLGSTEVRFVPGAGGSILEQFLGPIL